MPTLSANKIQQQSLSNTPSVSAICGNAALKSVEGFADNFGQHVD